MNADIPLSIFSCKRLIVPFGTFFGRWPLFLRACQTKKEAGKGIQIVGRHARANFYYVVRIKEPVESQFPRDHSFFDSKFKVPTQIANRRQPASLFLLLSRSHITVSDDAVYVTMSSTPTNNLPSQNHTRNTITKTHRRMYLKFISGRRFFS